MHCLKAEYIYLKVPLTYLPALKKNRVLSKSKFKCLRKQHAFIWHIPDGFQFTRHTNYDKMQNYRYTKNTYIQQNYMSNLYIYTYPWKWPRTKLQIFSFEMACRFWNSCRALNKQTILLLILFIYLNLSLYSLLLKKVTMFNENIY